MSVLTIALSVFPWPAPPTYTQLSVGNADAAVLHEGRSVCVIDTGEDQTLSTYLHQRRLSVDALVLTHLHEDHAGGLRALIDDHIPVKRCYLPYGAEQASVQPEMLSLLHELEARGTQLITVGRGDVLDLPFARLTVLWPEMGGVRPGRSANESSMALLAELHGTTLLLTGDLDGRYETYAAVSADLLKVAHHGSASSTSADFLARVSPQALLLSCGDARREGSVLERAGDTPVYATHSGGAITVRFDEGRYTITKYKQAP